MHILRKECKTLEEIDERARAYSIVASKLQSMQLKEALNYLIKLGNFQLKSITNLQDDRSCLSYRTFQRYKNHVINNPSKFVIAAICISMQLPLDISLILFRCSGLILTSSIMDSKLRSLLENYHLMSIKEIKIVLRTKKSL